MTRVDLNKIGQLLVVIAGFFASQTVLWGGGAITADLSRALITSLFLIALTVRYWWVILMLEWPFRLIRTALLLLVWGAVIATAGLVHQFDQWLVALTRILLLGAMTEVYNTATMQWRIAGAPRRTAEFRRDHGVGIASATLAALVLLACRWLHLTAPIVTVVVGILVAADWARLTEMILRHERLPEEETIL